MTPGPTKAAGAGYSVGGRKAAAPPRSVAVRRGAEEAASAFPPLLAEAERLAQTVAAGLHGRKRAGPGETFWQHRPYGFGDAASAIDWRQSARAGDRLYVRQNEWEAAAPVWLWRDPSPSLDFASSPQTPAKGRRADILATALAMLLAEAGERIGLITHEARTARPRAYHGRAAPQRILETLISENASGPEEGAAPVVETGPGASVVLISDFYFDPDAQGRALMTFAAQGARGVLLQIVDPAEEDFPYSGRVEFQDTESSRRMTFGAADARAADYRRAFAAHRAALTEAAGRVGWRFIAHRTDAPATSALMALYTAIASARL